MNKIKNLANVKKIDYYPDCGFMLEDIKNHFLRLGKQTGQCLISYYRESGNILFNENCLEQIYLHYVNIQKFRAIN